jgi:ribose transport system permease protein
VLPTKTPGGVSGGKTANDPVAVRSAPYFSFSPLIRVRYGLSQLSGPALGLAVILSLFLLLIGMKGGLGTFLSRANAQVLVHDNTIPAIAALGMLVIVISGGIDLSIGSVVALVTVVTMQVYRLLYLQSGSTAVASLLAVPAGIAVGGLCGLSNGLIITLFRVPPFVTTLGMLSIARGLATWLAERRNINFPLGGRPAWVDALAQTQASYLVFYPGFWSLVVLGIATAVFLKYTALGRYCYAIGSNEATARLCGVAIGRTKVTLYTLAGLLTGWAGVLSFAHVGNGDPSGNIGLELIVIAAVVIGGASLNGGQGTVVGTLLGVLILGILENGVSAFDVPVEAKYILIGLIIVINTALSQWQRRGNRYRG